MKSFHIILSGHQLGEELGLKNIEIAKSFGMEAEYFSAIPGIECKHIFKENKIRNGYRALGSAGQRGCFLSHFLLWKKCLELNETIAILEHDGVFVRSLPTDIENYFQDICRLEAYKHWDNQYELQISKSLQQDIKFTKPVTEYHNSITGRYYIGYYGYLVKPAGAEKLILQAKNQGALPVDMFVGTNVVDIVSVSETVIRLDEYYIGRVTELSTTFNFNNINNR